jgi:hypothetical protein
MKRNSLILARHRWLQPGWRWLRNVARQHLPRCRIKACSTVNPSQPVSVVNAVDDGSGIGFSLVWLNDKDGNLWMCDADAIGNVYSYSIVKAISLRDRPEVIGLREPRMAAEGSPADREKVCAAYLPDGGAAQQAGRPRVTRASSYSSRRAPTTSAMRQGDAMIWAFRPIGDPIKFPTQVQLNRRIAAVHP